MSEKEAEFMLRRERNVEQDDRLMDGFVKVLFLFKLNSDLD